jgi:hypothetical protein
MRAPRKPVLLHFGMRVTGLNSTARHHRGLPLCRHLCQAHQVALAQPSRCSVQLPVSGMRPLRDPAERHRGAFVLLPDPTLPLAHIPASTHNVPSTSNVNVRVFVIITAKTGCVPAARGVILFYVGRGCIANYDFRIPSYHMTASFVPNMSLLVH